MDEVSVRITLTNVRVLRQEMTGEGTGSTFAEAIAAATLEIEGHISGNGMVLEETLPWAATVEIL
jgi:hypothetical protein